ncbi:MAG: hypothetical protein V4574_13740 [Pseudomonadota bacterium]
MSGEKCTSYEVLAAQNLLREQARLLELQTRADAAQARLAATLGRAATLRIEAAIPSLAAGATASQLEAYIAAADAMIWEVEAMLLRRDMLRNLTSFGLTSGVGAWTAPVGDAEAPDPGVDERKARQALAARLIERVKEPSLDAARQAQLLAAKLAGCDDAKRAARLEDELRHAVRHANEETARRSANAQRATALLGSLIGLGGEAVDSLRARLEALIAERSAVPAQLAEAVATAGAAALAEIDRLYLVDVLRSEFGKAGYSVSNDQLTTAVVEGGEVVLLDSRHGDYGIRLRSDPEASTFGVEMVRFEDGHPRTQLQDQRDKEAEADFCPRFGDVRRGMDAQGIETKLARQVPIGMRRVETVARPGAPQIEEVRRAARLRARSFRG